MNSPRLAVGFSLLLAAATAAANTYTVTSTADSGAGTLRQAITDANANLGPDTIAFNITGTGPHTIAIQSFLPAITSPVTIDGYTQSGATPNTLPVGQGLNTILEIVLDGGAVFFPGGGCLGVSTSDTTIKGLVIAHCEQGNASAIYIDSGASNVRIEGNFLATDAAGTARTAQGFAVQVLVQNGSNVTVGGTTPSARNLISGCASGVSLQSGNGHKVQGNLFGLTKDGDALLEPPCAASSFPLGNAGGSGILYGGVGAGNVIAGLGNGIDVGGNSNVVHGNMIGTDVSGTHLVGQLSNGIGVSGTGHIIGGSGAGEGNVIGGVGFYVGLNIGGGGHTVQGNFIGTDVTGTLDLGNHRAGISVGGTDIAIGGTGPGEGNTVAFNGGVFGGGGGIGIVGQQVRIRGNRIFGNKSLTTSDGLGIDLVVGLESGVTPNDAGDGDAGPNGAQNYPLLTSAGPALPQGAGTHITGVLNSSPSTTFDLDFYSNPPCASRPQEYLEGQDYIGSHPVTTNGSGIASFDITLPFTVEPGARITATATDPIGNTSEFSQRLIFSMNPTTGPPAGGTDVTILGMLFEDGATVTVGGSPATNVNVVGPTQITAKMPARPAGSLNNVAVSNPDGTGGTLVNGWVADFTDVPNSQQFYFHIGKLVSNQITVGCGNGNYCPLDSVTRQQMAVFLLKSMNGLCYVPPPCTGQFPDVPCSSNFAPWIEALADAGITGGCGGGNYCPTNPVTRQQMAVFLLKAKHGSSYVPPACSGGFGDVPCPSQFADWIEQLAAEGITGGCGNGNYCPTQAVRRDQMAAFINNTFQLP
jgi:hypothetical protein